MERSNSDEELTMQSFRERERKWQQERDTLLKTISLLEEELRKQKALNAALQKKSKHKRTSSEEQTFIFNQTNISSYFPLVVVKHSGWAPKASLRSHLDSVRTVAFAGGRLYSAGEDASLKVWKRDKLLISLRQHLGPVYSLSASEDFVFTGGAEGVVRMWKTDELMKEASPCFEEELHEEPIWSTAFNQKKRALLTSSADQTLNLLRVGEKGLERGWRQRIDNDTPTVVEWMADNRFLSGFRTEGRVGVFEAETGEHQWDYKFEGRGPCSQVNCLQLSQKTKLIAAGHEDRFVRFFDPNTNKTIKEMAAHSDGVTGVHFGSDSFELLSTSHDGSLRVWDLRKYRCVSDTVVHLKKYDEGALCLSVSGDNQLAVGGADGSIKLLQQGE